MIPFLLGMGATAGYFIACDLAPRAYWWTRPCDALIRRMTKGRYPR